MPYSQSLMILGPNFHYQVRSYRSCGFRTQRRSNTYLCTGDWVSRYRSQQPKWEKRSGDDGARIL